MSRILATLLARKMTGEELKNLRKTLRLTQEELAEILGVTRVTLIRSEKEGPSRMVQSFIDAALRAGKLGLSSSELGLSMREPSAEYGKKPSKKRQKTEMARQPRQAIRGTPEAKERARKAAMARWHRPKRDKSSD